MKKIVTICLSLFFCIGMLIGTSTDVFASTNSGFCGADARWSFDETTGTLTISGTGDMHNSENGSIPGQAFQEGFQSSFQLPPVIFRLLATVRDAVFHLLG